MVFGCIIRLFKLTFYLILSILAIYFFFYIPVGRSLKTPYEHIKEIFLSPPKITEIKDKVEEEIKNKLKVVHPKEVQKKLKEKIKEIENKFDQLQPENLEKASSTPSYPSKNRSTTE